MKNMFVFIYAFTIFFLFLCGILLIDIRLVILACIIASIFLVINRFITLEEIVRILPTRFYFNSIQYGKCECKIRLYRFRPIIIFSYDKVAKNTIFKNDIFRFFKLHQTKYNKSIIVQGSRNRILTFYETIKNSRKQLKTSKYALKDLIRKNNDLYFDYIDREVEEDVKKVEINSATLIQLSKVSFISIMDANKIKNYIKDHGDFKSLWQFAEFMNLEQNQIELLIKYVTVKPKEKEEIQKEPEIMLDNLLDI